MVYNGHAITDIVLFWGNFNGQVLVFLWILMDTHTPVSIGNATSAPDYEVS